MVGKFWDEILWLFIEISWIIVNYHMINHVIKHKIVSIEPYFVDFMIQFFSFSDVFIGKFQIKAANIS